jgi:hypothetical protein
MRTLVLRLTIGGLVGGCEKLLPDGKMTSRTVSNHWIAKWIDRTTWSYFKIGLVGFSLPAAVLVCGIVVVWTASRRS